MSTHPGTSIIDRDQPPTAATPTDTSVTFMTAICERGPLAAVAVSTFEDWIATFGGLVSYGYGYTAAETFFRESGGGTLWTAREAGPAAVAAHVNVMDAQGSPAVALIATAVAVGDYYNGIVLTFVGTGPYTVAVTHSTDTSVSEASGNLATQQDAVDWSQASKYVRFTLGAGTHIPAPAAVDLAAGTDDHGSIVEGAALNLFSKTLGPGQVCSPGRTTDAIHEALEAHGGANNRKAVMTPQNTGTVATLATAGTTLRGTANRRHGALFAPWATCPGPVYAPSASRVISYDIVECGIIARNDQAGLSPNEAAAGPNGAPQWITGLCHGPTTPGVQWTDADLDTLHNAGVNVALFVNGRIQTMGYRTQASEATEDQYVDFAGMRLLMWVDAQVKKILDAHDFESISEQLLDRIHGEVQAVINPLWKTGELHGDTADEAYNIDTGPSVNTPTTIAAREVHVAYAIRTSPTAERLIGEHVKVATLRSVA